MRRNRDTARARWTGGGTPPPDEGPPIALRDDEPPELAELRDLFDLALEEVADALMVEPHLAAERDGELMMLAALRRLQAGLRGWVEGPMQRSQRRVSSDAADELRALVTGTGGVEGEAHPRPLRGRPVEEDERPARP